MPYVHGFRIQQWTNEDEQRFFEQLGIRKFEFLHALEEPEHMEIDRTGRWVVVDDGAARIVAWVERYRKHARSLDVAARGKLHRKINTLFFSMKEGFFVSTVRMIGDRELLRRRYIIPRTLCHSDEAMMWLMLAGAYVEGLGRKDKAASKRMRQREFLREMPREWLNFDRVQGLSPDHARAYRKFVLAINDNWHAFVDSYTYENHATAINNSPISASLDSFIAQRITHPVTGKVTRLERPPPPHYWPLPLSVYALDGNAVRLYRARQMEIEAQKNVSSSGAGSEIDTLYAYPRWLRMGIDGVDALRRPRGRHRRSPASPEKNVVPD